MINCSQCDGQFEIGTWAASPTPFCGLTCALKIDSNRITKSVKAKFLSNFEMANPGDCWPWQACKSSGGYGLMSVHGKHAFGHRIAYIYANGAIGNTVIVRHKCDNPSCVNPNHLEAGSARDNVHDMIARKRNVKVSRHDGNAGKLSCEDVDLIRTEYLALPRHVSGRVKDKAAQILADKFGVHRETIRRLCKNAFTEPRSKLEVDSILKDCEQLPRYPSGYCVRGSIETVARKHGISKAEVSYVWLQRGKKCL